MVADNLVIFVDITIDFLRLVAGQIGMLVGIKRFVQNIKAGVVIKIRSTSGQTTPIFHDAACNRGDGYMRNRSHINVLSANFLDLPGQFVIFFFEGRRLPEGVGRVRTRWLVPCLLDLQLGHCAETVIGAKPDDKIFDFAIFRLDFPGDLELGVLIPFRKVGGI